MLPSDVLAPGALRPVPEALPAETLGGGGTTSCVPKSLPTMLLNNPVFAVCVGGGGMTFGEADPEPPLSSLRKWWAESVDGGGAITDGTGRLSFALRPTSRSGAETGGGTTPISFICTRERATSRPGVACAGGITLALSVGVERARSRETRVAAGPITLGFKDGAAWMRSRETLGAVAMMLESRRGA